MSFPAPSRRQVFCEIALIFAVFFIQGAWPVPDVNETCYLAKAIHVWQPDWLRGDFFMESANAHLSFCMAFGWLSLWLSPAATAWTARMLIWAALAWAWRRLSWAIVPRAWWAVLTAALFVCLLERCHMAGEWVFGGAEAKPFAYAFIFLGIESLVRNRWNRALLLFGAASAFHVLVGGWSVVAAGVAWLWLRCRNRRDATLPPPLFALWPGLLGGLLLALPGIVPVMMLDWGASREIIQKAHYIYVFERLPHHLTLSGIKPYFILRLAMLFVFWLLLGLLERRNRDCPNFRAGENGTVPFNANEESVLRLRAFVAGAAAITLTGAIVNSLMFVDRPLAADLLRYYWFRLTDVAVPLGVALESVALVASGMSHLAARQKMKMQNSRRLTASGASLSSPRFWLVLAVLAAAIHINFRVQDHLVPSAPRSHRIPAYDDWRAACRWVADPNNKKVPPDAQFIVPRHAQAFKWYTGHGDVADWKDLPQSAEEIVRWWQYMQDIYATDLPGGPRWFEQPADMGAERLRALARKYGVQYVITKVAPPRNCYDYYSMQKWLRTSSLPGFDVLYRNNNYAVLRIVLE